MFSQCSMFMLMFICFYLSYVGVERIQGLTQPTTVSYFLENMNWTHITSVIYFDIFCHYFTKSMILGYKSVTILLLLVVVTVKEVVTLLLTCWLLLPPIHKQKIGANIDQYKCTLYCYTTTSRTATNNNYYCSYYYHYYQC